MADFRSIFSRQDNLNWFTINHSAQTGDFSVLRISAGRILLPVRFLILDGALPGFLRQSSDCSLCWLIPTSGEKSRLAGSPN